MKMIQRAIELVLAKVCFGKKSHQYVELSKNSNTLGNRMVTQEQIESARLIFLAACERKEIQNHLINDDNGNFDRLQSES